MEQKLALVRHGQTDWNLAGRMQGRTDIELNDTGRQQAREAGRRLAGEGWDLVLASPLARAQETAALMAAELGAQTGEAVPGIIERSFGPLEGCLMQLLSEAQREAAEPQTEPVEHVLQRMDRALHETAAQHPGRKILLVSHGGAMRIVRDALLGYRLSRGVANGEVLPVDLERLADLNLTK